jgi:hypothetical protein
MKRAKQLEKGTAECIKKAEFNNVGTVYYYKLVEFSNGVQYLVYGTNEKTNSGAVTIFSSEESFLKYFKICRSL